VELDDLITIATPEGIELELVLAGAGSRFIAAILDFALQVVLIVLAAIVTADLIGGGIGEALLAIAVFATLYVYDVAFEVLAGGRTPGKWMTHLRVVRDQGNPVDLPASAIRNLLRVIDLLPGAYLVGLMSVLLTKRNQRLGDLAAGTLVIRDSRTRRKPSASPVGSETLDSSGWDVSAVSTEELVAIRRFLDRRESLDKRARVELAHRLEHGLRAKVAGAPEAIASEVFLEALAAAKSRR
jgi:uncharacterized RDD family membrane protein YckC